MDHLEDLQCMEDFIMDQEDHHLQCMDQEDHLLQCLDHQEDHLLQCMDHLEDLHHQCMDLLLEHMVLLLEEDL
jgi:hypothetical protein